MARVLEAPASRDQTDAPSGRARTREVMHACTKARIADVLRNSAVSFEQAIERRTRAEELPSQRVDVEREVVEMVSDVLAYRDVERAANVVFVTPPRLQEAVEKP